MIIIQVAVEAELGRDDLPEFQMNIQGWAR